MLKRTQTENLPNFIFIHNPRTSGTSLSQYLMSECMAVPYKSLHSKASDIHIPLDGYFVFGFVRNPFSREYSYYTLAKTDLTFSQWVEARYVEQRPELQHNVAPQYTYYNDISVIYKYEDRNESLLDIATRIHTPYEKISSYSLYRNSYSKNVDYRTQYDNITYDTIKRVYQEDLVRFGYDFG